MDPISPALTDLARRMLAFEGASGPPSDAPCEPAARACERLRAPLSKLAGAASYGALLSRALALAKAEVPSLAALRVGADGRLERCGEVERRPDTGDGDHGSDGNQSSVVLLAHLLGLLVTFIGEPLALLLVRDAWPDVAMTGIDLAIKAKT